MENILSIVFTAIIVPFLTAVFNRENWNGKLKFGIAVLVSIVFGAIQQTAAIKLGWASQDGNAILAAIALVFSGGQAFFQAFPNTIASVEKNVNGVPAPAANIGDLIDEAISAATPLIVSEIEKKFGNAVSAATVPSVAGIPGAVPSEPQAQLGGPTVPDNPVAATTYDAPPAPTITPAPSVQAQVAAVTQAVASGTSVEKVVDTYAPVAG